MKRLIVFILILLLTACHRELQSGVIVAKEYKHPYILIRPLYGNDSWIDVKQEMPEEYLVYV